MKPFDFIKIEDVTTEQQIRAWCLTQSLEAHVKMYSVVSISDVLSAARRMEKFIQSGPGYGD